jgi:hypothetical protein
MITVPELCGIESPDQFFQRDDGGKLGAVEARNQRQHGA